MKDFNRNTHCFKCHREFDEIEVKLKKIVVGPDTYRRFESKEVEALKFEKYCTDCIRGK